MAKRILSIIVCLAMITVIALAPLAQPVQAIAGTIVVGAVIAVLAVAGITFAATMSSAQLQSYVSEKLDEWAASLGQPLDHLINTAGIGMTISGLMTIGTAAANGINDFILWFKNSIGLGNVDSVQVVPPSGGVLTVTTSMQNLAVYTDNGNTFFGVSKANYAATMAADIKAVLYKSGNTIGYCVASSENPVNSIYFIYIKRNSENWEMRITSGSQDATTGLYFSAGLDVAPNGAYYPLVPVADTLEEALLMIYGNINNGSYSGDQGITVESGIISVPNIGQNDKYYLDVGALPGDTAAVAASGVIADAASGTLTVSGEVAESQPDYVIEGPVAVTGLDDVFPFCIPFDIYNFLTALAADPEPPIINWRFYVPGICDETIELDFSVFEPAAVILRTMELLAFCVGLAFVTRKLIRG